MSIVPLSKKKYVVLEFKMEFMNYTIQTEGTDVFTMMSLLTEIFSEIYFLFHA